MNFNQERRANLAAAATTKVVAISNALRIPVVRYTFDKTDFFSYRERSSSLLWRIAKLLVVRVLNALALLVQIERRDFLASTSEPASDPTKLS